MKVNPRNKRNLRQIIPAIMLLSVFAIIYPNKTQSESKSIENDDDSWEDRDTSRDHEGDTFSIVAYDPNTQEIGGAGTSCYPGNINFLNDIIFSPSGTLLGAIHTQAAYTSCNQGRARTRMLAGDTPAQIIAYMQANDCNNNNTTRQYGIVGIDGGGNITTAGFTGSNNGNWAGNITGIDPNTGMYYAIQGNILDTSTGGGGRQDILDDMETSFRNATGTLADKLMAALQGAKRVGGDNRCINSGNSGLASFVRVQKPTDPVGNPSLDLWEYPNVNYVEPIDVLQCSYDTFVSTPHCRTTINSFPYVMDFETKSWEKEVTCNIRNSWIRTRFATPSANTGPTIPSQGALYAFVESDDLGPDNFSNRVVMGSPCFEIPTNETTEISFDYHMFGATMGTLSLTASNNGGSTWTTLWSESGNKGNSWNSAVIDLTPYAGSTIKLRIDATTGNGSTSDMAIDNIRIGDPPPPPPPVNCVNTINTYDYNEGFEGSIGLWLQESADDGDWIRYSGATPSGNTGPSGASEGSEYIYIEASTNGTPGEIGVNATAILESPCFDFTNAQTADFSFDYHSWGANTGIIALQISEFENIWVTIFSVTGVNNNAWVPTNVNLDTYVGKTIKLRFIGTTGNGFASDLALDNVQLSITEIPGCAGATKTWNGSSWSPSGQPGLNNSVIINGNYNTGTHGDITACSLTVNASRTLTVTSGGFINVDGDIQVDGTLDILHQGSVVQTDPNAFVTKNGTINVHLTTPNLASRDFMVMGSPMTAETRDDVWVDPFLVLYHDTSLFVPNPEVEAQMPGAENFADDNYNNWIIIDEGFNTPINPGEGYIVRPQAGYGQPGGTYNYTYKEGTLNNGDITFDVIYNGNKNSSPNVVANPYPSAISALAFIAENSMVDELFFWEHNTPPSATLPGAGSMNFSMQDISMYNNSGGIAAVSGGNSPNEYISTGQGFAFKATAAGTALFNNDMRRTDNNNTFRRPDGKDRIWLKIANAEYQMQSTTLVAFSEEATIDFDPGYDSRRLATVVSFFSGMENQPHELGIQTRGTYESGVKIPLGYSTLIDEKLEYKISIENIEGVNLSNANVYLRDNFTNTIVRLELTDSSYYSFESEPGTFYNRFTLIFQSEITTLGNSEYDLDSVKVFPNPTSNSLTIYSPNANLHNIEVYDILGKRISEYVVNENNRYSIDLSSLKKGVYFVKIDAENGSITKKVIKK